MGPRGVVARVAACCVALCLAGAVAHAQDDPAYPAATCAALWTAHARTPLGPGADPLLFRDEAVRLSGDAEAVDAFIATHTMRLTDLIYALIDSQDGQSREVFDDLLGVCRRFAASSPQIAAPGTAPEPSG